MILADFGPSYKSMPTMRLNIIKFDAFVIATSPILMTYRFFISGVSIADFLMVLSVLLHLLLGKIRSNNNLLIIGFSISLLFLHLMYAGISGEGEVVGYFRTAKICLLLSFIMISFKDVRPKLLERYLKFFVILSLTLLCYQYFVYYIFDKSISLIIPYIPLVNSDISIDSIERVLGSHFRPGGPFMEPAHLSYYLFFCSLFIAKFNDSRNNRLLCAMAVGLFSTFSSFGFFSGVLLSIFLARKIGSYLLIIPMVFVGVAYFLFFNDVLSQIPQIARLIDPQSVAITGRLFAGSNNLDLLAGSQVFFGTGFGNFQMNGQVNGVNYLIVSFGYIGAGILAMIVGFNIIMRGDRLYKIFLIITLFFSSLMLGQMLIVALLPLWNFGERRN